MTCRQHPALSEYLRSVWYDAYNGISLDVDWSGEPEAAHRIRSFRQALYNYRKKVRINKLKPPYTDEWSVISKCEIKILSPTRFIVQRIPKLIYNRKVNSWKLEVPLPILNIFQGTT